MLDRPAPSGILDAKRDDTQALDPAQMERLDNFIAELKKRGIYADLNLNVARPYKPGDGVKDAKQLGFAKASTFFDPRLLELQKAYARLLLTHKNPYTGATYAQEPAVALVEMVNENSLLEAWMDGRLREGDNSRASGTWKNIPDSYAKELTDQYNAWLPNWVGSKNLERWRKAAGLPEGAPIPRLTPEEFTKAPAERFRTEAYFYFEIESRYFNSMKTLLRVELGVKALLLGNSDHNHSRTGYPQLTGTALLDVVDGHTYWQHPSYTTDPQTGRQNGFTVKNTPMVDEPLHSAVVELTRSAFAGKPYTVSEVNFPFPNETACEGIPALAAYAAFQDWDGIFWYTLAHRDLAELDAKVAGHFDLAYDPVKMAQLPAGALIFLRGDVSPARQTVTRSYTHDQVIDGMKLGWQDRPYFTAGFPLETPLRHGSRITSLDGAPTGAFETDKGGPLRSDTGELAWAADGKGDGLITVDTARSQAAIGHVGVERARLKNMAVTTQTPFCAVTLGALDERPVAESGKLLLTAAARMANTGMEWDAAHTTLTKWGEAPTRIEPVKATVTLTGLAGARQVTATPLTGAGAATPEKIEAEKSGEAWKLTLDKPALSYLVTVTR